MSSAQNAAKNIIQLEVFYFTSSGSMINYAKSPEALEAGKRANTFLMFNDRIYYILDSKGVHTIPEIPSNILVNIFALQGLKNNVTINNTVQYADPNVEVRVNATYFK